MSDAQVCSPPAGHLIGVRGSNGPVLMCLGGVHGNEPAGVVALRRVVERLDAASVTLQGRFVALLGNGPALERGERYVDADLNRLWRPGLLSHLERSAPDPACMEQTQLTGLRRIIDETIADARHPVYFVDLHTTSGASVPFGVIGDTLPNREFATMFPVPIVLGVEERVEGTVAEYAYEQGCVTFGFEAGQHDDPVSIDLHESAIWLALHASGLLAEDAIDVAAHRRRLQRVTAGTPRFLEVRHHHPVAARQQFEMVPGFRNFQHIGAGDLIARDRGREVRAPSAGRIFMPLYQPVGTDGFFIVRSVPSIWLRLSAALRRLGLGGVAPWMPGVRRHPTRRYAVVVDPRIARWRVVDVFHLLGYRHASAENGALVFARREHDVWQKRRERLAGGRRT